MRLADPAEHFHGLQFAVNLAGLGCPEMIQRIPEYGHNLIPGFVSVADQPEDAMLQHNNTPLQIFHL